MATLFRVHTFLQYNIMFFESQNASCEKKTSEVISLNILILFKRRTRIRTQICLPAVTLLGRSGELGLHHTVPRAVTEEKCPGDTMKFSKRPYYKINFIIKKGTRHLFYDVSRRP